MTPSAHPLAAAPQPVWRCTQPALTLAAVHAAALFAVDPVGIGGAVLKALPGPARDGWLALVQAMLPPATPWRRVPLHINDERLLGGLDLAATLQAGRPIAQHGVLTLADGGVVLLAMAERLAPSTAARVVAVLDTREVALERDGLAARHATRFGVIALDEGLADDEHVAPALLDRLAFALDLHPVLEDVAGRTGGNRAHDDLLDELPSWSAADIATARALLPKIGVSDDAVQVLVATAAALGVASLRAPMLALQVARAAAALDGRWHITEEDTQLAAALVLAPRATQVPMAAQPDANDATDPAPEAAEGADAPPAEHADQPDPNPDANPDDAAQDAAPPVSETDPSADNTAPDSALSEVEDRVLAAARAAIPAGLLAALMSGQTQRTSAQASGRAGALQKGQKRGRPSGARRGEPRAGARLNVIETLRAAAPWQKIRHAEADRAGVDRAGVDRADVDRAGAADALNGSGAAARASRKRAAAPMQAAAPRARVQVRREDFHITRYQQRSATTTVFVVDASGSAALNRLAEAKGAVELLLADCYVRRDQVAVLAFRGHTAELLLPPTRSLVRAKRSLAGLPGGGGTPLASGIDAAAALGLSIARRGETPIVVLLTDGRGNIARDGTPGRARAGEDVQSAARQFRATGVGALLIDTAPQPQAAARQLADDMGARYLPLPYAGSTALSHAVALAAKAVSLPPGVAR